MAGKQQKKRWEITQSKRRASVAALVLDGYTYRQIAEKLGNSTSTINKDVCMLLAEWREGAREDFDDLMQVELQRLDLVLARASEGWLRSLKDEVTVQETVSEKDGAKTVTTTKPQAGDSSFLDKILSAVARRVKILGLEAPEKKDVTVRAAVDFDALCGRSPNPSNVVDGKINRKGSEKNGNGKPRLPTKGDE